MSDVRGRILLVEDDAKALDAQSKILGKAGFEVAQARSAAEAAALVADSTFDAVFTDESLPDSTGLSVLKAMRMRKLPVVMLFARLTNDRLIEASDAGVFRCLSKPVDAASLQKSAADAVGASRTEAGFRFAIASLLGDAGISSVRATDVKNEFSRVLDMAVGGKCVVITRHEKPKALLLPFDQVQAAVGAKRPRLDALAAEFDEMVAGMQTPAWRSSMRAAFDASPEQLGKNAVKAARKRRG